MRDLETVVVRNRADLIAAASQMLCEKLSKISLGESEFHLGITGGAVGVQTLEALAQCSRELDLSKLHVWWVDERFVARNSPDRNELQARNAWLSESNIPEDNIHPFPSTEHGSIDDAATSFAKTIELLNPEFDLVLLGMGEDGHVASLFPGSKSAMQGNWIVVEKNSPKPPAERLSLSLEALNSAKEVLFLVSGKEKAEAVGKVFSGSGNLPAESVSGKERTIWLLDDEAASLIISS
jgi:6-phosphogluconolactonase